jgi:hypothetical protein
MTKGPVAACHPARQHPIPEAEAGTWCLGRLSLPNIPVSEGLPGAQLYHTKATGSHDKVPAFQDRVLCPCSSRQQ